VRVCRLVDEKIMLLDQALSKHYYAARSSSHAAKALVGEVYTIEEGEGCYR
jgi:hypothetical protein